MSTEKFQLTLYGLFLGDQDPITGHYKKGYVYQTITGAVVPRGGSLAYLSAGKYSSLSGVAYTNYEVQKGDVIKDELGNYWEIIEKQAWPWGNQFVYYECDVKKLLNFPFTAGFFGFEILSSDEDGNITQGFETGFERGYFAL